MKKFVIALLISLFGSNVLFAQDNKELQEMADQDQQSRFSGNIDWTKLAKEDSIRRVRILELMKAGNVVTAKDYYNAGIIFQHGNDTISSALAVENFKKAITMDTTLNKWWYVAAVDRDLMRRGESQIYGTQFIQDISTGKMMLYQIDTTKISDQERNYYGVETLAQQREKERRMNLKSPGSFYLSTGSIEQTVDLINKEVKRGADAEYNVKEEAINSFGYQLLNQDKLQEAIRIFELNTHLHPEGANAYDSLGEALRKAGQVQESITAYQRSLELDPTNENAQIAIKELEKVVSGN